MSEAIGKGEFVSQVQKFQYLGVHDGQITAAAVMQTLHRSVVVKRAEP